MKDILSELDQWIKTDQSIAIATVIQTWGSAPRGAGSKMGITAQGAISGSVSGGCVEGAVVDTSLEVLRTGIPQLLHFGVADETAWEVGLACGGTIDVFVSPLDPDIFAALFAAIQQERTVAVLTVIRGEKEQLGRTLVILEAGSVFGTLGDGLDETAQEMARVAFESGKPARRTLPSIQGAKEIDIFVDVILPSPALVIVGGVHISIALADIARVMGFRTIVVDPRRSFGNQARFPNVDRLIQVWPDQALSEIGLNRSSAVAVLTHDPKLDDPALMVALRSQAFYVGALGSTITHARRRQRLLEAGLTETQLSRLHAPIGLDIHARTPEEIALSVMAEIIAAWRGA